MYKIIAFYAAFMLTSSCIAKKKSFIYEGKLIFTYHTNIKKQKHGPETYYHDNGNVKQVVKYKKNIKVGKEFHYNDDQTVSLVNHYDSSGKLQYSIEKFHAENKPRQVIYYDDNQNRRKLVIKHDNGQVAKSLYFNSLGAIEGKSHDYDYKGNLTAIHNFSNGQLHGHSYLLDAKGKVALKENYTCGQRNGAFVEYKNGKAVCSFIYKDDKLLDSTCN